jgi:hypothetical protein
MFRFDGSKTMLYLFVSSHVVTQNRYPLLRNMLLDQDARAVTDLIEPDRPLYLFVLSHHLIHQPVST